MQLRDYQVKGVKFLTQNPRAILADEVGIGKTAQALRASQAMEFEVMSMLIVCPKSAFYVWLTEIPKWLNDKSSGAIDYTIHEFVGNPFQRAQIIEDLNTMSQYPHIIITTYDVLKIHKEFFVNEWYDLIIADEAHKFRNRKTQVYKAVKALRSRYFFALTGTPATRGAQDLWALLNIIKPELFRSYWKFVNAFCHVEVTHFGRQIYGTRNHENLRALLENFFLRRTKVEVLPELPPKTRQIVPLDLTPTQRKVHDSLKKTMIAELEQSLIVTPSVLTALIRMRQLLVTPQLLDETAEPGAALVALGEHLEGLGSEPHAVVFTPFAQALPIIEQYLRSLGHSRIIQLRGGLNVDEVQGRIGYFECGGLAICTIKFAQSFSLSNASVAYFLQYEWNPDENEQAEGRLHRFTSRNAVTIYYFVHHNTVDQRVLEVLDGKSESIELITRDRAKLKELL